MSRGEAAAGLGSDGEHLREATETKTLSPDSNFVPTPLSPDFTIVNL